MHVHVKSVKEQNCEADVDDREDCPEDVDRALRCGANQGQKASRQGDAGPKYLGEEVEILVLDERAWEEDQRLGLPENGDKNRVDDEAEDSLGDGVRCQGRHEQYEERFSDHVHHLEERHVRSVVLVERCEARVGRELIVLLQSFNLIVDAGRKSKTDKHHDEIGVDVDEYAPNLEVARGVAVKIWIGDEEMLRRPVIAQSIGIFEAVIHRTDHLQDGSVPEHRQED
mmetsp:Transcript_5143/g.9417  ORF Transcript_5143/g.9417 Transcript_5143/m.9417 type:complete len:227 (+) Transcript_5143:1124-1804(+)